MALLRFWRKSYSEFLRSEKIHWPPVHAPKREIFPTSLDISIVTEWLFLKEYLIYQYHYYAIGIGGKRWLGFPELWSGQKPKWNWYNPCGEFWWSPEDPVSQIHSPHLHIGAPGIFSDLVRSVQMLKTEWGAESNGKLLHLFIPGKTAALVPESVIEDLLLVELHPWFLRLQWRTCSWAEHTEDAIFKVRWVR